MPRLNEQRIVKKRSILPFNYEKGRIGWFKTYYAVEEWYAPNGYWGWHIVGIIPKEEYEERKKKGEVLTKEYYDL